MQDIYGFLSSISEKDSNNSRLRKLSSLKSFFNYLKKIEVIKYNVILDMDKEDKPKKEKRMPKYFTLEECKKLINSTKGRNQFRDKVIIMMFLTTGMRLSELVSLNVEDIKDSPMRIIGKGNKEREVYLCEKMDILLKEYLKSRPKKEEKALFLSQQGNKISGRVAVQDVLRNAIKSVGLNTEDKSDVLVHILRHTYATLQHQNGVDIRALQQLLGHESIYLSNLHTR